MACGHAAPLLPSGATHDASAMADLCPVGMIFTRCRDGISHNPDEYVDSAAMSEAICVLEQAISWVNPA
jgi:allantoate deiminase